MKEELRKLVRELGARALLSEETDWHSVPELRSGAESKSLTAGKEEKKEKTISGTDQSPETELAVIAAEIEGCSACPLGKTRIKTVPGIGLAGAKVLFIGEGPGYEEDRRGEPFVGKAGQLLDKIIGSIGLSRETVFIANMVKCHPMKDSSTPDARGNDRPPSPEELAACRSFIERQIRAIRPSVIVALGAVAAKSLLGTSEGITRLRGNWKAVRLPGAPELEIPVLPTYHPAALLRDETLKRAVWNDMKALRDFLAGPAEKGKMPS